MGCKWLFPWELLVTRLQEIRRTFCDWAHIPQLLFKETAPKTLLTNPISSPYSPPLPSSTNCWPVIKYSSKSWLCRWQSPHICWILVVAAFWVLTTITNRFLSRWDVGFQQHCVDYKVLWWISGWEEENDDGDTLCLPDSVYLWIVVCLSTALTHPIVSNCLHPSLPHLSLPLFLFPLADTCPLSFAQGVESVWTVEQAVVLETALTFVHGMLNKGERQVVGGGESLRICSAAKCLFLYLRSIFRSLSRRRAHNSASISHPGIIAYWCYKKLTCSSSYHSIPFCKHKDPCWGPSAEAFWTLCRWCRSSAPPSKGPLNLLKSKGGQKCHLAFCTRCFILLCLFC